VGGDDRAKRKFVRMRPDIVEVGSADTETQLPDS
jgi:hypothetical protein